MADECICSSCGARLRCSCGQFVRADSLEQHFPRCPFVRAVKKET